MKRTLLGKALLPLMASGLLIAEAAPPPSPVDSTAVLKSEMEAFLRQQDTPTDSSMLRAEQISLKNIDGLPLAGPDSIAGLGDWWLSNGRLCAAVSDIGHDAGIVAGGGTLIDLGYCDRADDQWTYANMLTGLAKETAVSVQQVSAQVAEGLAEVRTVGEADGLRQTLLYRLRPDSDSLELEVRIERIGEGRPLRMSGLFMLYSQRSLTPFGLSSYSPDASLGFHHPDIDRTSLSSLVNGLKASDWNILVGASHYEQPISYGLQLQSAELIKANGTRQTLPRFLVILPNYSLHGWMTRPLWLNTDELGWAAMLQNQLMDLEQGEQLQAHFVIRPGTAADVASVTDTIYQGPQLHGYSNHPGASISVWDDQGRPLSQVRVDKEGSFKLRLPKGISNVKLQATAAWGERITREIAIEDARNDSGRWLFSRKGQLQLPRGNAMSLSFFGVGDTDDPVFGQDLLDFSVGGQPRPGSRVSNRIDLAGVDTDPTRVDLPPGHYRVIASRGMEYQAQEYLLTIMPGMGSVLPIVPPKRAFTPEDWLSADLHVHSGASFDSTLPFSQRLHSFVAQGAQLLVASEHNRVVDYRDQPEKMGLADVVQVITGSELTSLARTQSAPYTIGHSNVFPIAKRPHQFAGGIIPVEDRRLHRVIANAKQQWPGALFQLNHPRAVDPIDNDLAFFEHLSIGREFDPKQPLVAEPNRSLLEVDEVSGLRDIDFDLIEILNGGEFPVYKQLRKDWFALLRQGAVRTATGNSDSHDLGTVVAAPRNYLYLPGAATLPVDEAALVAALQGGRSFITTGPFIDVWLQDEAGNRAQLGEQLSAGRAELHVDVRAANWVWVDKLKVWLNGELYRSVSIAAGEHAVVELLASSDAFVVVEVTGPVSATYGRLLPGLSPLALSNPIFIDANGDGQWTPPQKLQEPGTEDIAGSASGTP